MGGKEEEKEGFSLKVKRLPASHASGPRATANTGFYIE
jgi:hypothetical protein